MREALSNAVKQDLGKLHSLASRFFANRQDVEDVVQDALVSAWQHIDEFRGDSKLTTWLGTIVRRHCLMRLRKYNTVFHLRLDALVHSDKDLTFADFLRESSLNPEETAHHAQCHELLMNGIRKLSPVLRETYWLRDIEELSIEETANLLNRPSGTIKARLSHARRDLSRHLRRLVA